MTRSADILGAAWLERWKRVVAGGTAERVLLAAVADAVADGDVTDAATATRLRRHGDAELVRVAIELVRARRRAARKLAGAADLAADVAGVEQATSTAAATHKARRFAAAVADDDAPILDLCCGLGGDAMALARVAEVLAVDRLPVRAWMTAHNAGCATRVGAVEDLTLAGALFHLDPARRSEPGPGARRAWRFEDYRPGPAFIDGLLTQCPGGAIKLGPGVDLSTLPLAGASPREIEIINEGGTLVQAVLWCGRLAHHPGQRTATRLPEGLTLSADPRPVPGACADGWERYLLLVDPAIERAGLVGALVETLPAMREIHAGLGVFTAPTPPTSPWVKAYEVLADLPWRLSRIRDWLAARNAGVVTVKTRGKAVNTDQTQQALRGGGDEPFTVFGLRLGSRRTAVIVRSPSAAR